MSDAQPQTRRPLLLFATVLGFGLLAYLILRTGPQQILAHTKAVGWGLVVVILLGGVAHLVKTWAWRLTFRSDLRSVSITRTFALRLSSEAAGNLGIAGQLLGDTMRVSLLGSAIPVADSISSVALDRGLYMVTTALVSITGMVTALLIVPVAGKWRLYAVLFIVPLVAFLVATAISFWKQWPVFSKAAKALARIPGLQQWVSRREAMIVSVEENLLSYYHQRPKAFWTSLMLNLSSQGLAITEVFLLLYFMRVNISYVGAFVLEALTKVINLVGTLNPGNVGTYEGGNMLITRLFQITSATGLTLALCRRARAIFWGAIGALCLIVLSRTTQHNNAGTGDGTQEANPPKPSEGLANVTNAALRGGLAVVIWVEGTHNRRGFIPALTRVGQLPVLLRVILSAEALQARRIIVCLESADVEMVKRELSRTKRLPASVEWCEGVSSASAMCSAVPEVAVTADRIMLLSGTRTYKPALLQSVIDWNGNGSGLVLTTDDQRALIYAPSPASAGRFANEWCEVSTLDELHGMKWSSDFEERTAPKDSWQDIVTSEDLSAAEHKLDTWLVKPTDGIFARNNRRISIPISRQLIKFPITPNMVTFFTLGVSIAAGIFFSRGGYWNVLLGAVLSVWASILDGCDGEVARLKLQSTAFGCWLETICDYLYYVIIFVGIAWGLTKTSGTNAWLLCGGVLLVGAGLSFVVVGSLRQRMAGDSPDKFLAIWQKAADGGRRNPLLYVGRHTEFLARRCFFPYALLVAALLDITKIVFAVTAFGANMVWIIALYSLLVFSRKRSSSRPGSATQLNAPAPQYRVL